MKEKDKKYLEDLEFRDNLSRLNRMGELGVKKGRELLQDEEFDPYEDK